jgi:hypothetical protein
MNKMRVALIRVNSILRVPISPTSTIKLLQLLGRLGPVGVQFDSLLERRLRLPRAPASAMEITQLKRDIGIIGSE